MAADRRAVFEARDAAGDWTEVHDISQWALTGRVYQDGSMAGGKSHKSLRRASWAAVQVDDVGDEVIGGLELGREAQVVLLDGHLGHERRLPRLVHVRDDREPELRLHDREHL